MLQKLVLVLIGVLNVNKYHRESTTPRLIWNILTLKEASYKWRHFLSEGGLLNAHWHYRYALSYRNLEERRTSKRLSKLEACLCKLFSFT
jgi:hypothetical protein